MIANRIQIELTDSELSRALAEFLYAEPGIASAIGHVLQEVNYRSISAIGSSEDESGGRYWVIDFDLIDPEIPSVPPSEG